ncbi:hypothetical protein F5X99DRAFT_393560 [Biscogniauxia marginata]|nr:hypothetical protein F5X99DRAFT_393560 [Biscogniauxia marginata]
MFSPYHRFWFSPGFDRLPPPPDPFNPSSGKLMLQFTPASISNITEPEVPLDAAKISVGPRRGSPCFPFNFYGISLGCDSKAAPCVFNFTGLRYDYQSKQETATVSQTASVFACLTTENCKLSPIVVSGFEDLTSVLITSKVDGEDKTWWADDLTLGWFDNSCKQAVCRSKVRNTTRKRDLAIKKLEDVLTAHGV